MRTTRGSVGRGSARAEARDVTKGQSAAPFLGSGGASPYRASRGPHIERVKAFSCATASAHLTKMNTHSPVITGAALQNQLWVRGKLGFEGHLALQWGVLRRTSDQDVVSPWNRIPFLYGRVEISERTLI